MRKFTLLMAALMCGAWCATAQTPDTIKVVSVTVVFPKAGDAITETAATVTIPEDANYLVEGTRFLSADGNDIPETKFNPNTTYKFQVFLKPKENYVFPLLSQMTLSINGEEPTDSNRWSETSIGLLTQITTGDADFLATPVFSDTHTWFHDSLKMELTCGTAGADFYYTIDGTEPSTTNGTHYSEAFTLYATGNDLTIKAIAVKDEQASDVVTHTYNTYLSVLISAEDAEAGKKTVTLGTKVPVTSPIEIRYTTDGNATTASSTQYTAPFTIDKTTTIKARVYGVTNVDSSDNTQQITVSPVTAIDAPHIDAVYAENGRIVCEGAFCIYDLLGRDVTRLNGSLCGVYVVKTADSAVKVVVK